MAAAETTVWYFEEFELDRDRAVLTRDGRAIDLRPKSFDVLVVLMENAGRIVTKDEIMGAVWPDVVVTDDSLVRCVHEIRLALGEAGTRIIKTRPRRGYMFAAELGGPLSPAKVAETEIAPSFDLRRLVPPWLRAARTDFLAICTVAVLTSLGIALFGNSDRSPVVEPLSIAVLGFADLSADRRGDRLGKILTEEVLTNLTSFPDLKIIGRGGIARNEPPVGRGAAIRHLLTGSIARLPQSWSVTVRIVDSRSNEQLWSRRYETPINQGAQSFSGLAQQIAANVESAVSFASAKRLIKRPANGLSPKELVLLAQRVWFRSASRKSTLEARAFAKRALDIDPHHAPAHVEYGKTFYRAFVLQWEGAEALEHAQSAAQQAILIDQRYADAFELLARVYLRRRQHEAAITTLEKALQLNPHRAATYASLADALTFSGRAKDAIALLETAVRLDPNYPPLVEMYLGRAFYFAGDNDRAALVLETCVARAPGFRPCYMYIAAVYAEQGRQAEAGRALTTLKGLSPRFTIENSVRRHLPFVREPMIQLTASLAKAGAH